MTETFGGVVYDGLPLNGVEMRIVDSYGSRQRTRRRAGPDRAPLPTLLRAYRDGTDPVGPGGWLRTGDVGSIDRAGHLHVHGRSDDLIITGGENVWPSPVEAVVALDRRVGRGGGRRTGRPGVGSPGRGGGRPGGPDGSPDARRPARAWSRNICLSPRRPRK